MAARMLSLALMATLLAAANACSFYSMSVQRVADPPLPELNTSYSAEVGGDQSCSRTRVPCLDWRDDASLRAGAIHNSLPFSPSLATAGRARGSERPRYLDQVSVCFAGRSVAVRECIGVFCPRQHWGAAGHAVASSHSLQYAQPSRCTELAATTAPSRHNLHWSTPTAPTAYCLPVTA